MPSDPPPSPQTAFLDAMGFKHHSTSLDDQATYHGHGLSLTLPVNVENPFQIQAHILSSARAAFRSEARQALTRIIGHLPTL